MIASLFRRSLPVAVLYLAVTIGMTWPITNGLRRDLPNDLGDPAFVAGIMAWGADHWIALFSGDLAAASRFWDAPFFYPEPLVTAYSEHFALHSLLTLPIYVATGNIVLCYNVWFLSTFVLGALGVYLLVRDLTGHSGAAFVAGLAFAFAPYRIATLPHLQVLSSHWMPFVLLGLRRYVRSGNTDALLGAGLAWWAQNLSSGYYMLFFGPFVAVYTLIEMSTRRVLREWRVWRDITVTAVVVVVATMPFALPYLARQRGRRRPLSEVIWYSADLKGWLTASPLMNVWGGLQTLVKAEGLLFPGATVVLLAGAAIVIEIVRSRAPAPTLQHHSAQGFRVTALFGGIAIIVSFWLSLGPEIQSDTHPTGFPSLYRWAWEYLPGFGAARVPARFATITVLALALLAGAALAVIGRRRQWVIALAGLVVLAEGSAFPLPVNGTWTSAPDEFVPAAAPLHELSTAPPVFRYLRDLPGKVVVAHLPFGLPEREIQYGYYAALHGKRIINGYSGAFPSSYVVRAPLRSPLADPQTVFAILEGDGVTHVVVHSAAWTGGRGMLVVEMMERARWQRLAQFDSDYIFVPAPRGLSFDTR